MKKEYIATNIDGSTITGSIEYISSKIGVSRQYAHKKFKNKECIKNEWLISVLAVHIPKKRKTKSKMLSEAIILLNRARIIIDDENERICLSGGYANIGIVDDIDRFLKDIK